MSPPQEFAASSSWLCSRAELRSAANNWWRGQPCCTNCYGLVSAWFCTFYAAVAAPSAPAAALSCCGWGCHCHQHWQQSINIQKVGHTVLTAIGECAYRQFSIGNPSSFCSSSLSFLLSSCALSLIDLYNCGKVAIDIWLLAPLSLVSQKWIANRTDTA